MNKNYYEHRRTRQGDGGWGGRPPGLENFQGKLCFQGKRKLLKILNVKSIFTTAIICRASASCSKIVNCEKIFNTVYIPLGTIHVIWASVVCKQDQRRDWL